MLTKIQENRIKEVVDAAMQQRGEVVNSYSQVEFLFGDLIRNFRNQSAYSNMIKSMPFSPEKRIEVLTNILTVDGPLTPYRDELDTVINKFNLYEDDRHFLTHGFAIAKISPKSNVVLEFRKFTPSKTDQWHISYREFTPAKFEYLRDSISEFTRDALSLFRKIYLELKLEETKVVSS